MPYSVVFPVQDIAMGELVTRDFVPVDMTGLLERKAYLLAFEERIANEEEVAGEEDRKMLWEAYQV